MKKDNLWVIARLFIGLIFVYTGLTKLVDPVENFRAIVAEYRMIPYFFVTIISYTVPWVEFLAGVFLILGYMSRWSALVLGGMSAGFVVLLGGEFLLTGKFPLDCGCFGAGFIKPSVPQVFSLDILNSLLGLRLFLLKNHPFSLDGLLRRNGQSSA